MNVSQSKVNKKETIETKLRNKGYKKSEIISGILFSLPGILGFIIFIMIPMISSLYLSFTEYNVITSADFIGFENYKELLSGNDPLFYKSLMVTTYYVILSVPLSLIFAFFIAVLLNQKVKGLSIFRTIFYLPTLVPIVATSVIWLWIYNPDLGLANSILRSLNLPTSSWIFGEATVIPSLVIMQVWVSGGAMLIFLAGLQGIPKHLYEAIEIDGGSAFRKLIHITIPMLTPTIFFNFVMACITAFQVFAEAYIMTEGGPNNASLLYVFYLYREAFFFNNMGKASALAWVLFIIIALITLAFFKTAKRWVYYEGGDN